MVAWGHILGSVAALTTAPGRVGQSGRSVPALSRNRAGGSPACLMERTALFLCRGPKRRLEESVRYTRKGEAGGKMKNTNPISLEGNVFPPPSSLQLEKQIIAVTTLRKATRRRTKWISEPTWPGGRCWGGRPGSGNRGAAGRPRRGKAARERLPVGLRRQLPPPGRRAPGRLSLPRFQTLLRAPGKRRGSSLCQARFRMRNFAFRHRGPEEGDLFPRGQEGSGCWESTSGGCKLTVSPGPGQSFLQNCDG